MQAAEWLYKLIFAEVTAVWTRLHIEAHPPASLAPQRLCIQEYLTADWQTLHCQGPLRQLWLYAGSAFLPIPDGKSVIYNHSTRGQFFLTGIVHFCVTPDCSRILWNTFFGPRYGRGMVFRSVVEKADAVLVQDTSYNEWVM